FGRDDGVDRVLLHQHAICKRSRDRTAGATLPDHAGHDRNSESRQQRLRPRDHSALAVLLGRDTRIGARNVDEAEQWKAMQFRELHQTHRLAIALWIAHSEIALGASLELTTFLFADKRDRAPAEPTETNDECVVVGAA